MSNGKRTGQSEVQILGKRRLVEETGTENDNGKMSCKLTPGTKFTEFFSHKISKKYQKRWE